jgi:hypothetical protein
VLGMVRSHDPAVERARFRTVMLALMDGLMRRDGAAAGDLGLT